MQYKLGKTPARANAIKFKLSNYLDKSILPKPPASFGHDNLVKQSEWKMLGNDKYGDCVFAGAAHETVMWNREASLKVPFSNKSVLKDYSIVTGFNPNDPNTDQGTDMKVAASYRRKTGITDTKGNHHKVAAYLEITKGDYNEHLIAAYLFGAVGIGIEFPSSAIDQFNAGKPWEIVKGSKIEGGHYVPFVGLTTEGYIKVISWSKVQLMTKAFFEKYNDESVVYLSQEMLKGGATPEGFNLEQLKTDLADL